MLNQPIGWITRLIFFISVNTGVVCESFKMSIFIYHQLSANKNLVKCISRFETLYLWDYDLKNAEYELRCHLSLSRADPIRAFYSASGWISLSPPTYFTSSSSQSLDAKGLLIRSRQNRVLINGIQEQSYIFALGFLHLFVCWKMFLIRCTRPVSLSTSRSRLHQGLCTVLMFTEIYNLSWFIYYASTELPCVNCELM